MLALIDLHPYFFFRKEFTVFLSSLAHECTNDIAIIESGLTTPLRADIQVVNERTFANSFLVWSHLRQLANTNLQNVLPILLPLSTEDDRENISQLVNRYDLVQFSSSTLSIIIQNLSRWDYNNSSIGSIVPYIKRIAAFWAAYYAHFRITKIVGHICHSGEDLVGMFVAKALKIPFFAFNIGCTDGIFILDVLHDRYIQANKYLPFSSLSTRSHFEFLLSSTKELTTGIAKAYTPIRSQFNVLHHKTAIKQIFKSINTGQDGTSALYMAELLNQYRTKSLSLTNLPFTNHDNVYLFFMQMQPEATTVPCSNSLHNQLDVITYIRSQIPADSVLLVKEHVAQFSIFHEIPQINGIDLRILTDARPLTFYSDITSFPNTYLLDLEVTGADLCSKFNIELFTSVGTVGIEFFLSGIPVHQIQSWSPYSEFLLSHGMNKYKRIDRIKHGLSFFSNYTFEISQLTGEDCSYLNRELFSTQYFREAPIEERLLVSSQLASLIANL